MKLKTEQIFPLILIVCDICAALFYVPLGDWRKVIYWIAAAILSVTVTF